MNPKTRYIRTARVNKYFTHCLGGGVWYLCTKSVTFDNLVDAQKKLDNEVEFLYIERVTLLISAEMNRAVADVLAIPKEKFGDCI